MVLALIAASLALGGAPPTATTTFTLPPKALNGPPSSFAEHDLPDPAATAVPSRAMLFPFSFSTSSHEATIVMPVGPGPMESVSLSVFVEDPQLLPHVSISVESSGRRILPAVSVPPRSMGINHNAHQHNGYVFTRPPSPGQWEVTIKLPAEASKATSKGMLMVGLENQGGDDVSLWSSLDTNQLIVGKTAHLFGTLMHEHRRRGDNSSISTFEQQVCSVEITTPSGAHVRRSMHRHRLPRSHRLRTSHGLDEAFEAGIELDEPGLYTMQVRAELPSEGNNANSHAMRMSWHSFKVAPAAVTLTGRVWLRTAPVPAHCAQLIAREREAETGRATAASVQDSTSLQLELGVRAQSAGRYRVFAQVWAAVGEADEYAPVCWAGAMVNVEEGESSVSLRVDQRWLPQLQQQLRSKRRVRMQLRNVRLEDSSDFIPVSQLSQAEVEVGQVDVAELLMLERNSSSGSASGSASEPRTPTKIMLQGCPPAELHARQQRQQRLRDALLGGNLSHNLLESRLALVHGYCSGTVWPEADFTNAATFRDLDQSRSNDHFALLIGQMLEVSGSSSIVAHSQGGLASLHLWTYYSSNLDLASMAPGRLLQSVGSPYTGCPLAGLLAVIGEWFGVGCGTQADLTYDGAQRWLAGIPSSARSAVHYYFTEYGRSGWIVDHYCNLPANAVLSWPNDGVVEVEHARLPSATLVSNVEGECHTDGMNWPAQCQNVQRNAQMSAAAARVFLEHKPRGA